jgi:hypothetical protein
VTSPNQELIARIAAQGRPVRRLGSPGLRAIGWLALVAVLGCAVVMRWADLADFVRRTGGLLQACAWLMAIATGVSGVIAASYVSFPDRSRRWAWLPLPFLVLWLALSGIGCVGLPIGPDAHSGSCVKFILMTGSPITAFLMWRLWRAHPIDAGLTGLLAALGAAGLSAALLQFFHPFAITALDLALHLAAAAILMGAGLLLGRLAKGRLATV